MSAAENVFTIGTEQREAARLAAEGKWAELADFAAVRANQNGAPASFAWRHTAEIFAPLPSTPWIVPGLQICPGRPSMLAGYGNAGKTITMQCALLQMATGQPVWGRFGVPQPVNVRQVDHEQGKHATFKRYQRLALGLGIDAGELGDRICVSSFPDVYLNQPGAEDAYAREFDGVHFAFIDALKGATPGEDENDSKIRACVDVLTRVSEKIGCAFLLLHHAGKPKEGHSDMRTVARGSSAIFDACGSVWIMVGAKGQPRLMSHQKTAAEADGGNVEDFQLTIEDVNDGCNWFPVNGPQPRKTSRFAIGCKEPRSTVYTLARRSPRSLPAVRWCASASIGARTAAERAHTRDRVLRWTRKAPRDSQQRVADVAAHLDLQDENSELSTSRAAQAARHIPTTGDAVRRTVDRSSRTAAMTAPSIRAAHGTARRIGDVAECRVDKRELAQGVARHEAAENGADRSADGTFTADGARKNGRKGGAARRGYLKAADAIGIGHIARTPGWAPYGEGARKLAKAHVVDLARLVAGGVVPAMLRKQAQDAANISMASSWAHDQAITLLETDRRNAAHLFAESARWGRTATSMLLSLHALAQAMAPKRAQRPGSDLSRLLGGSSGQLPDVR